MSCYLGVFGHTAIDIILQVQKLPKPNSSVAVKERVKRRGGTAANIAKAAGDLDVDVSLASFVGEDFPDEYERSLKRSGVMTYDLKRMEDHSTPTCWILSDHKEEQMAIIDQGAAGEADRFDVELQKRTIEGCEVLHIGTGRPEYYEKILDSPEAEGKTIGFDPAQELRYVYDAETFERFISRSDHFFCNEEEATVAQEYLEVSCIEDILDLVDTVIVTRGDDGSSLYTDGERKDIPSFEPDSVLDPTGAGDAYRAGFYSALSEGNELEDCCLFASARASFSVEQHGPQEREITREMVNERLKRDGFRTIN